MAIPKEKPVKEIVNQDKATVALIFGVVSFFTFLWWFFGLLFGVLGIAFGVTAIRAKQDRGRSIAGIVLGASGILLGLAVTLILVVAAPKTQENSTEIGRAHV